MNIKTNKGKILISSLLISACLFWFSQKKENKFKVLKSQVETKYVKPTIKVHYYTLDTLNFSGMGIFSVIDDNIYIIDELFKTITITDAMGNMKNKFEFFEIIKKSKYPDAFKQPMFFLKFNNKYLLLNGRKITSFNDTFHFENTFYISFFKKSIPKSLLDIASADNMDMYDLNIRNITYCLFNNKIFLGVESEHPKYNPYISTDYYKTANVFGIFDPISNILFPSHITKTDVYNKNCCLVLGDGSYIASLDDKLYVQHALDPSIYEFTHDIKPKSQFGLMNGLKMIKIETNTLDLAFDKELYDSLQNKMAYFENIFSVTPNKNQKIIGRIFVSNVQKEKYIQLYENYDLIRTIKIPYGFKYFGNIQNKLYGTVLINKKRTLCVIQVF